MFNDISFGTKDNEEKCLAHARIVFLHARRFGKVVWSVIGPGSEKKWYSMKEDSPQGIWDNPAEKKLIEFVESGCPIFRAAAPLSRSQLKSKAHGKLSIHFLAVQENDWDFFSYDGYCKPSSVFTEQSRRCVKNVNPFTIDQGDLTKWWDNQLCSARSGQKFLWIVMTQRINICFCNNMKNELRRYHNKTNWVNSVRMQDFLVLLRIDSISWRKAQEISPSVTPSRVKLLQFLTR